MTVRRRPKHLTLVTHTPEATDPPPREGILSVSQRIAADPRAYDDHEDTLEEDLARECGIADLAPAARQAVYARAYIQGHSAAEVANVYPALAVIARLAWDTGVAAERENTAPELLALRAVLLVLPKCEYEGCKRTATRSYANAPGRTPVCDNDKHLPPKPQYHPVEDLPCAEAVRRLRAIYNGDTR